MSANKEYLFVLARLKRRGLFHIKPGFERISQILSILGNPQKKIKTIHVAGTNGKGSVCATLESVLRCSGYRTGLYTSPELVDVRERIRLQGTCLSQADFCHIATLIFQTEKIARLRLTYFEFLTVMAFYAFSKKHVDIAVIEVGLGGRWDATNVLQGPEVSVITSIGLDHTQWLGDTREQIAIEKAGIIKPGVEVICGADGIPAQMIRTIARQRRSRCRQLGKDFYVSGKAVYWEKGYQTIDYLGSVYRKAVPVALLGPHQGQNAGVVLAAIETLLQRGWRIPDRALRDGFEQVQWPGRWEFLSKKGPIVVCDGAHNPAGVAQLLATLEESPWRQNRAFFVVGGYKDKDGVSMARLIAKRAVRVYTCTLPGKRARSARVWAQYFREQNPRLEIQTFSDPIKALRAARRDASWDNIVLATGSLALMGYIRSHSAVSIKSNREVKHA